jgi:HK97 family phage portal protein
MSIRTRVQRALKSLIWGDYTTGSWYGGGYGSGFYGGTINYQNEAGDLTLNAIVMAYTGWITTNFAAAPLVVKRKQGQDLVEVQNHPLTLILSRPNEFYSGSLLWRPTLVSYYIAGNAYWLKGRNGSGRVVELSYEPHDNMRCVTRVGEFISYYQVKRGGYWIDVPREDVVHFRNGLNPLDVRYGLSPLASALREIYTDNEAARFSAAILRNMGVPGVIISSSDADYPITDPVAIKNEYLAKFTGDRRGEPLVSSTPLKIDMPAFSPSDMSIDGIRRNPEARIGALLGIHPAVVGLLAGLEHSTYSNMEEAFAAAYRNNLVPTQTVLADELDTQLLDEFGNAANETVEFDYSKVEALQESKDARVTRAVAAYNAGIVTMNEARDWLDLSPLPGADAVKTPAPALAPPLKMLVNANGHGGEG